MRVDQLLWNLAPFKLIQVLAEDEENGGADESSDVVLVRGHVEVRGVDDLQDLSEHLVALLSWQLELGTFIGLLGVNEDIPLAHVPTGPHVGSWWVQLPPQSPHDLLLFEDNLFL